MQCSTHRNGNEKRRATARVQRERTNTTEGVSECEKRRRCAREVAYMHLAGKRRARACIYAPGAQKVNNHNFDNDSSTKKWSSVRDQDK